MAMLKYRWANNLIMKWPLPPYEVVETKPERVPHVPYVESGEERESSLFERLVHAGILSLLGLFIGCLMFDMALENCRCGKGTERIRKERLEHRSGFVEWSRGVDT